MLTFSVAALLAKPEGSKEVHHVDEPVRFDAKDNLVPVSNLIADLTFYNAGEEIGVLGENMEIDLRMACSKCLKKFTHHVKIDEASRTFFMNPEDIPQDAFEGNFLIDMKRREISLFEMVRQELLLHFPLNPVCLKGCQGLCPACGQDLNVKECGCERKKTEDSQRPFAHLKDLFS